MESAVPSTSSEKSSFDEKSRFIEALARAWQQYGVSSTAMLEGLARVVHALGLNSQLLATPNHIQIQLWSEEEDKRQLHLIVSRSGNFDLAKLALIQNLAAGVETGEIGSREGLARLREIAMTGSPYTPMLTASAFVLCGASFAAVLGAGWFDALFGGLFSLISFGATRVAARSAGIAVLQEVLAAMIASFLATAAASFFPAVNPIAVTACAILWFVPGFGLTIAPLELIVGNTLSGLIWFSNAFMTAFKLVGGATIGLTLAHGVGIPAAPAPPHPAIEPAWTWAAIPVLVISLAVLMKAGWRTFGGIAFGGLLVWGTKQLGGLLGFWEGTFLGSAVLMIYSNWYARRFRVPSAVMLLPCVMILLPGLAALSALRTANAEGIVAGLQSGSGVLAIIIAILGGALAGGALAVHNLERTGRALKSLVQRPHER